MDAISDNIFIDVNTADSPSDDPSLLTVIMDLTPAGWYNIRHKISLQDVIKSVLVFLNAHLSLNNSNQVAFIASTPSGSKFLYPTPHKNYDEIEKGVETGIEGLEGDTKKRNASSRSNLVNTEMYRQFRVVDEAVLEELNGLIEQISASDSVTQKTSTLSGALSLALTYTNRMLSLDQSISTTTASALNSTTNISSNSRGGALGTSGSGYSGSTTNTSLSSMMSRVLIISANDDDDIKYIPIMNCTFAAQKMKLSIDVAKLGSKDLSYLQQASDATNGIYLHVENPQGLIQTLSTAFFIESSIRPLIILPTNSNVNYRASCFITGKSVDLGYVCSVCLCIMSMIPENGTCPTCNSAFDDAILSQLRRGIVIPVNKKRKIDQAESKLNSGPAST